MVTLSIVAVAVILTAVVLLFIKARFVNLVGALLCGVWGFTIGITPIGGAVGRMLAALGRLIWRGVTGL